MTHPSIKGLREAVAAALDHAECPHARATLRGVDLGPCPDCTAGSVVDAIAAYLTEHGVLLSGEGLVELEYPSGCLGCLVLVPVPQDGG